MVYVSGNGKNNTSVSMVSWSVWWSVRGRTLWHKWSVEGKNVLMLVSDGGNHIGGFEVCQGLWMGLGAILQMQPTTVFKYCFLGSAQYYIFFSEKYKLYKKIFSLKVTCHFVNM